MSGTTQDRTSTASNNQRATLSPSPTAVDSAIMAAADNVLAGIKQGSVDNLYPKTPDVNPNRLISLESQVQHSDVPGAALREDQANCESEATAVNDWRKESPTPGYEATLTSSQDGHQHNMFSKITSEVSMASSDASNSEGEKSVTAMITTNQDPPRQAHPAFPALPSSRKYDAPNLKKRSRDPFVEVEPLGSSKQATGSSKSIRVDTSQVSPIPDPTRLTDQDAPRIESASKNVTMKGCQEKASTDMEEDTAPAVHDYTQQLVPIAPLPEKKRTEIANPDKAGATAPAVQDFAMRLIPMTPAPARTSYQSRKTVHPSTQAAAMRYAPIAPAPAQEARLPMCGQSQAARPAPAAPLQGGAAKASADTMGYAPIMPRPSTDAGTPNCLSRREGAYLQPLQPDDAPSTGASLPLIHVDYAAQKTTTSPATLAAHALYSKDAVGGAAVPTPAHVLHMPSFPTTSVTTKPSGDTERSTSLAPLAPKPQPSPSSPIESASLRNKKMQATDCLLFAASLLQEAAPVGPTDATANGLDKSTHSNRTINPDATTKLPLPAYPAPHGSHSQHEPRELDVLCGRGGLINKHVGNIIYRRVVEHNKSFYQKVPKRHRILVSQSIVHTILNRGGRFLSEDTKTVRHMDGTTSTVTLWKTVATARAIQKTSQALRERVAAAAAATK